MYISPPFSVLTILAVGLTGIAWLAPLQSMPPQKSVQLSEATFGTLELWGRTHLANDGNALSVSQVIEAMMGNCGHANDNFPRLSPTAFEPR
jgi:hypothetical protein